MKLIFSKSATAFDAYNDEPTIAPDEIDGLEFRGQVIGDDRELADLGVIRGGFRCNCSGGHSEIQAVFWVPGKPSVGLIETLKKDVAAQLEDLICQLGLKINVAGRKLVLLPDFPQPLRLDVLDDGRVVPEPSRIAKGL